ncbi:MAG TPA: acylphosphatase [Candidatus Eisenbacteria bacterium]
MSAAHAERLVALIEGRVQGVGFRYFVRDRALALGLAGMVRNLPAGAVEVVAEGPRPALDLLLGELHVGPPLARVQSVAVEWLPALGARDFRIRTS